MRRVAYECDLDLTRNDGPMYTRQCTSRSTTLLSYSTYRKSSRVSLCKGCHIVYTTTKGKPHGIFVGVFGNFFHGVDGQIGTGRWIIVGMNLTASALRSLFHGCSDIFLLLQGGNAQDGTGSRRQPKATIRRRRRRRRRRRPGSNLGRHGAHGGLGRASTQMRQDKSTCNVLHDEGDEGGVVSIKKQVKFSIKFFSF